MGRYNCTFPIPGLGDGALAIDLSKVPETAFFDANKVINIASAQVISSDNYARFGIQPGGNDVLITSNTGERKLISRLELIKNYRHTNGKKIKLSRFRNNKRYKVWCRTNETYKVTRLPNDCFIQQANGKYSKGSGKLYLVLIPSEDGRQKYSILNKDVFQRQFIIPMQDLISRLKDKGRHVAMDIAQSIDNSMQNTTDADTIKKHQITQVSQESAGADRNDYVVKLSKQPEAKTDYRYSAIARIINTSKQLQGFVIRDNRSGQTINCSLKRTAIMARDHMLSNIIFVSKADGSFFIKGNNIKIESLPEFIQDSNLV